MCECGLFPVYSQQVRSPTSDVPIKNLPGPFKALCLHCIYELDDVYQSPGYAFGRMPGLREQWWDQSMEDTFKARYLRFHSDKEIDKARLVATDKNYTAAWRWIHDQASHYFWKLEDEEEEAKQREQAEAEEKKEEEEEKEKAAEEKEAAAVAVV